MKDKEPRRRPFKKQFMIDELPTLQDQDIPVMERAARLGLAPEPLLLVVGDKGADLYMDRIRGFELGSFPKRFESLKFSTQIAVQLAELCQRLYDTNLYHDDMHEGNVMYDVERNQVVAVDTDSLLDKKESIDFYVDDFACITTTVYLGYDALDGWLGYGGDNPDAPEYFHNINKNLSYWGFKKQYGRKVVEFFFQKERIAEKADPRVLDFILRCWDPKTQPQSFDEIFALKSS